MKLRASLATRILSWFFLNLLLLVLVVAFLFRPQFNLGIDWLINSAAGDHAQAVAERIASELRDRPRGEWDALLAEYGTVHGVEFGLFHVDGHSLAGTLQSLPREVSDRMRPQGPPPGRRGGPPPFEGPGGNEDRGRRPPSPPSARNLVRTVLPTQYWLIVRLRGPDESGPRPIPITLIARSPHLTGGGFFFDVTPWLLTGVGVVVFCALFWLPLVLGITRAISELKRATEQIAEGRFDVRINTTRGDELGSLAQSVNRLADRLNGFVIGQKRFLGDIAHELCAPIARLQMIVGILERHVADRGKDYVQDASAEVQEMSALVNELLSFSKAGLKAGTIAVRPVELRSLVQRVLEREDAVERVQLEIPEGSTAQADPELLARALANLIRNAVRYAGPAASIRVISEQLGNDVHLTVMDSGPGVPEEDLPRLFDPFYRVESSRSRDTGGVGLGMAIVKTCVEACRGTVTARSVIPTGLAVTLKLPGSAQAERVMSDEV